VNLLENVESAFASIDRIYRTYKEKLENYDIELKTKNVREVLNLAVSTYESENYAKVQKML